MGTGSPADGRGLCSDNATSPAPPSGRPQSASRRPGPFVRFYPGKGADRSPGPSSMIWASSRTSAGG